MSIAITPYQFSRAFKGAVPQSAPVHPLLPTHESLRRMTPAMASGLTDHVWTLEELLREAAT